MLKSKINQITNNDKHTKKKIFSRGFKYTADSLEECSYAQESFAAGNKPTSFIQVGSGYGAHTIDFTGVICNCHKELKKKAEQETISTHIKHKPSWTPDIIEKELIVSSIFDPYFHVTNSGEMVDVSQNSEVVGNVVSALQSEYCNHIYNQHNEHCDAGTTWYD